MGRGSGRASVRRACARGATGQRCACNSSCCRLSSSRSPEPTCDRAALQRCTPAATPTPRTGTAGAGPGRLFPASPETASPCCTPSRHLWPTVAPKGPRSAQGPCNAKQAHPQTGTAAHQHSLEEGHCCFRRCCRSEGPGSCRLGSACCWVLGLGWGKKAQRRRRAPGELLECKGGEALGSRANPLQAVRHLYRAADHPELERGG